MASSQPLSSSTNDVIMNIIKENNFKEREEDGGGYGNGFVVDLYNGSSSNKDDDMINE